MWQRYNQSTHIFEKSTNDGVTWTPLGLNASIITEGTIDPARLPTMTSGDVVGPGVSVNDDVALFSGVTGKLIKDSGVGISKVARNDIANTFALRQTFIGPAAGGNNPQAEFKANNVPGIAGFVLNDPNQSANIRKWRIITLGSDLLLDQVSDDESVQNWLGGRFYRNQGLSISGWLSLGGGNIYFPGAQNANAGANVLDDYEEGTWTPSFNSSDGNTSGTSYSLMYGKYVKVGRSVFISFDCALSACANTGTGTLYMNGLPFPVTNDGTYGHAALSYFGGLAGAVYTFDGLAINGTTSLMWYFKNASSSQMDAALVAGNISPTLRMMGSGLYFTLS